MSKGSSVIENKKEERRGYTAKTGTEAEAIIEAKKEAGIPDSENVAGEQKVKVENMCNQCQQTFDSKEQVQAHIESVHSKERRG